VDLLPSLSAPKCVNFTRKRIGAGRSGIRAAFVFSLDLTKGNDVSKIDRSQKKSPVDRVIADFSVSQLVSILLDGLEKTRDVVAVLERDSALDGRTREALADHLGQLAKLVVDAEVFRTTLQVRLNNLAAGSSKVQRMLAGTVRDGS